MKKFFSLLAVVLLCGIAASAQNIEDIRIYINPGHGSWGPNNRHMATIGHDPINSADPDTTDFYESNTNLWKCLEMFHRLKDCGFKHNAENALDLTQNLVMSRIANGPYPYVEVDGVNPDQNNAYNRTLSEVAQEVEINNFDMFISVHSNALTDGTTTNYPIYLYRGYDNKSATTGLTTEVQETSYAMAQACWPYLYSIEHMNWSSYSISKPNIRGDIDFMKGSSTSSLGYTGYYGVLKHGVPGFIVEGYFHTYQPARHRAMNPDVCRIEGLAHARGVAAYYGALTETTGEIYGIVRDLHEKFSQALYTPKAGTLDVYKPLNEVDVTLKQGETVVATYKTDVNYNGAFVFFDLQPGDYTLEFSHADYKPIDPVTVTVKAAETSYPAVQLEAVDWVPPAIVYENYPDPTEGYSEYTLLPDYDMTAKVNGAAIAELEGKTVRRIILRDGKLYILAFGEANAPHVYVYDVATGSVVKTLGTTAAVGDIYKISDIALTADGYLVGINKANQAYGGANNMKAYKWEKDEAGLPDGEVAIWWENNFAGNWSNGIGGEACYYNGTLEEGQFVYTGTTTASNGNTRIVYCDIAEGVYIGHLRNNQDGNYLSTAYLGETYSMTLSPRDDNQFVVNSSSAEVIEYQKNAVDVNVPTLLGMMGDAVLAKASANESYFKYAGRDLMVAPNVNADGKLVGIKVFDITDGLDKAVEVVTNCNIDPIDFTYASAHGELETTLTSDDKLASAKLVLYLTADGKVTRWNEFVASATTPGSGGTANPFAYALSSELVDQTLTVNYSLNAAATDVNIVVRNEAGEEVARVTGELTAGAHTATIDVTEFEFGKYTWAVVVDGEEKSSVKYFANHKFWHPAGLTVDNSMESASFGTLFVAEGYSPTTANATNSSGVAYIDDEANVSGLYIFDPQGNLILSKDGKKRFYGAGLTFDKTYSTSTQGDVIRVALADDGRIFAARGSDSGDYLLYAESLEKLIETGELTSLVSGQTMTSMVYNDATGNFMLGPVFGLDVMGSGDETKMVVITNSEVNTAYSTAIRKTVEYTIGADNELSAPTVVEPLAGKVVSYGKNTTVKYDNEGGIWFCQYRGTNTAGEPGLVYVDANGVRQYLDYSVSGRRSGAMDVSPDGKYLAAMSGAGKTTIYKVMKLADGSVMLRESYILSTGGNNMYDLAWDAAGNLYACNASSEYVRGYAIPRTEPFETKAASIYAFEVKDASGIENVDVEEVELPVVYYNLQGVQVPAENLAPGIYVKVQGNKSEKVIIR